MYRFDLLVLGSESYAPNSMSGKPEKNVLKVGIYDE